MSAMATAKEDVIENREATASGLMNHFQQNQKHEKPLIHGEYTLPAKFDVTSEMTGVYHGPLLQQASADRLNDLLLNNQLNYHVYFSETGGFHNHRVHHLMAAYALGATPEQLQSAHDTMENIQRPRFPVDRACVDAMYSLDGFKSMLGDDSHFHNYLAFFLEKFERHDWREVTKEYLFSNTEIADDLFMRLFAGIWHNFILFGYGVEFEQPGIVAESLAGACVHSNCFAPFLLECERLATESTVSCKSMMDLLQETRDRPDLCDKQHWKGGHSFAYDDMVVSNAPPGMAKLAAQWKIDNADDLSYRAFELLNVNAYLACAAQRAGKKIMVDFIFVHHINASIFFSAFLEQDWLPTAAKIRLLEAYTRINLLFYAASLGPQLFKHEIVDYTPDRPDSTWQSIIQRSLSVPDDGHLPKLIRALAHGEALSRSWEENGDLRAMTLPVRHSMWLRMANMAIDSAESEPDIIKRWVRGAGSDAAWAIVGDRKQ